MRGIPGSIVQKEMVKKKKKKSEWIAFHSCKDTHPHTPLPPLKSGLKGTALEVHSRRAWLFPHVSSAVSARDPVSGRRQVRSLEGSQSHSGRQVCVGVLPRKGRMKPLSRVGSRHLGA